MKKKIKLNKLILFFFIVIASIITVGLVLQYNFSKKMTIDNYINQYNSEALNARDEYRLLFDKILYQFKSKEKENIQKLNYLFDVYKKNNGNLDVDKIVKELNKGSNKREYEFLLINRDYIIEKGSYTPDIGWNLGKFEGVKEILKSVFDKKVTFDIASPKIETSSMSMKRYLLKLSHDEKYLLQIIYDIPIYEEIKKISERLTSKNNSVSIFIAQPFMVQAINLKSPSYKKRPFNEIWKNTKLFLNNITKHEEQKNRRINDLIALSEKKQYLDVYNELLKIYTNENGLISFLKPDNKQMVASFIANGVFDGIEDIKLIVQLTSSTEGLIKDINKSFFLLFIILLFTFALLFFIYMFVVLNVSSKLINIINSIKENRRSSEEDVIVEEIQNLDNSYNNLHILLNKEIEQNKLLLMDNKRFIADTVHQIKTPLSNIMMNTDMMKIIKKDDESKEFIEQIDASINMLTNSYEDLSYITSHDVMKYSPADINLSDILTQRILFFKTIAKVNNKEIIPDIEKNLKINMNQIEYERLIDNNISNAIKYGSIGKPIEIKLHKENNNIILTFSSYGEAIKNPDKVFNREYRENEAKRGLGLGLNMVKLICEKYMITYSTLYKENKNIFTYIFKI